MKIIFIITTLIVAIVAAWFVVQNQNSDDTIVDTNKESNSMSEYETIKKELADDTAILLDVRTPEEFLAGHIAESTNLSLQDIENGARPESDKDIRVYVYCRSGNRSEQAANILRSDGYSDVINLGGLEDVANMGAEIVR